jgi:hypothetical protein
MALAHLDHLVEVGSAGGEQRRRRREVERAEEEIRAGEPGLRARHRDRDACEDRVEPVVVEPGMHEIDDGREEVRRGVDGASELTELVRQGTVGAEPAQDDRVHRVDAGRKGAGAEPEREIEVSDRHERKELRLQALVGGRHRLQEDPDATADLLVDQLGEGGEIGGTAPRDQAVDLPELGRQNGDDPRRLDVELDAEHPGRSHALHDRLSRHSVREAADSRERQVRNRLVVVLRLQPVMRQGRVEVLQVVSGRLVERRE